MHSVYVCENVNMADPPILLNKSIGDHVSIKDIPYYCGIHTYISLSGCMNLYFSRSFLRSTEAKSQAIETLVSTPGYWATRSTI